ncbi:Pentatricopeptide repeat-containing protein [Thalictrum thalictroides]|uniref:Pentatricopeptide repeat-containing protein n=1 Tax=Thalictrum thalictroides TaxID=46969 RepID=A0A7J6WB83_THATH|nr:Pentatricopeptide repeat-containing protein [Thalictrum thalictroides]
MFYKDSGTWNSMINGYAQKGRIDEARSLFDSCVIKNVRTWTSIVTAYAKYGMIYEARKLFDEMPERNVVSWNAMINGYVQNGDFVSARCLFDEMPERVISSWNTLITGYTHSSQMDEANHLFEQMEDRDMVTWMVMISGYFHVGDCRKGWDLFVKMHHDGVLPDQSVFVVSLSAITGLNDPELIETLRTLTIKTSYEENVVVGTAILNAYTRTGKLNSAFKFFETMPERNEYSWTTMISAFSQSGRLEDAINLYGRVSEHSVASQTAMLSAYAQSGRVYEARQLFDEIPNPNVITWNAMVSGYAQHGMFKEARIMFFRMPVRNAESWAALISAFAQKGQSEEALWFLSVLHRSGMVPSHSCFTSALFACANVGALEKGRQLHTLTVKAGCQFNSHVGNGLISMYAKCRNVENVSQVFKTMRTKDIVSWNSLISGLSQNDMLDDARSCFEKMPKRDVVSWTSMISAYAQAGLGDLALQLFIDMLASGIKPNSSTVAGLLVTCGTLGAAMLGRQIHNIIFKLGLDIDIFVGNSLITMYFKCGCKDGFWVFEEMNERDIVTWNALLIGCAQNGFGMETLEIFEQMKAGGVLPDQASFLGILFACSHAGLVDKGWFHFNSMKVDYGIMPNEGHYACMVDLLGRAGRLHEAEVLIEDMPIEPDSVVWAALLGACRIHRNLELGRRVAERLFQLEPHKSGNYILLSNIYASLGMWGEVKKVRMLMRDRGVTKEPGISWIQIKNKLLSFSNGDKTQDQIQEVYKTLKEFCGRLREAGYVPDTNFVLHDVEEEQKEDTLLYHSEKLAIAYGLLNTPHRAPIQIMKNLRICGDCHCFTKFLSKVTQREIVIRDGNRFHHFQDGLCSCGDYW